MSPSESRWVELVEIFENPPNKSRGVRRVNELNFTLMSPEELAEIFENSPEESRRVSQVDELAYDESRWVWRIDEKMLSDLISLDFIPNESKWVQVS